LNCVTRTIHTRRERKKERGRDGKVREREREVSSIEYNLTYKFANTTRQERKKENKKNNKKI
jgi:hypothetical protein